MQDDIVSIIVPIYNVEKYLKRCIKSILGQTYKKIQIILVDDGSTDNCPAICDEYAEKDNRIKVIHKKNGGLSDARNAGIKHANGKYITFIDSDDYIDQNYIQVLYESIIKTKSDIAIAGHKTIYPKKTIIHKAKSSIQITSEEALYRLLYDKELDTSAWAKLYKTALFNYIKYPKGRLFEDTATTYKLLDTAKKITIIPKAIYNYEIRDNSISTQEFSDKKMDMITSTEEMTQYIFKKYPQLENGCNRRLMFAYLSTLSQTTRSNRVPKKYVNIIMKYIRQNRRKVLNDKNIPKRDRYSLYITYFGYRAYKTTWKLYQKIFRS